MKNLHQASNYSQELYNFLRHEGIEGYRANAYVDSVGKPTIGVGFNLHDSTTNLNLVLQTFGFDVSGTQLTGNAAAAERAYIQRITEIVTSNDYPATQAGTQQLQNDLNAIMQARANNTSAGYPVTFTRRTTFAFNSETESRTVFDAIIPDYEERVFTQIRNSASSVGKTLTEANIVIDNLRGTNELIALVSLKYSGVNFPATAKAILSDNRSEAWFEIRYNSNRNGIHANRRYAESDLFDLFDDGPLTVEGTKEVFRMFTKHQSEINAYESAYPPPSSSSIALYTQVQLAKDYLVNQFGQGKTIDNIIVGAGLQSYEYLEKWTIDKILGTDGNDLIFGEKEEDYYLLRRVA